LKAYVVFNIAQIDGLPAVEEPEPVDDVAAVEHRQTFADCFIATTGADLRTGEMACFMPGLDVIELPPKHVFATPESYYATALHELGHWSGHASRLARDLTGRFGSRSYAAEELVAELTAAFLCAHLAIQGELRHAGYIQSWIELLRDDKRAIFTAASQASQAAGYLRAFSEEIEADDNFTAP
jgi:antirestriction protein ArdC